MKFSDPTDEGSHLALEMTASAVAAQREKARPEQKQVLVKQEDGSEVLAWETEDCVDCGEPIESGRLTLARVRCVSCQRLKEQKEASYARK